MDFVERLAPFAEPRLLLREERPLFRPADHDAARKEAAEQTRPKSALEMLTQ